jgi:hypothetical protein
MRTAGPTKVGWGKECTALPQYGVPATAEIDGGHFPMGERPYWKPWK